MGQVCIERVQVNLAIVARDGGEGLLPNGPIYLELGVPLQRAGGGAIYNLVPRLGPDRAAAISSHARLFPLPLLPARM